MGVRVLETALDAESGSPTAVILWIAVGSYMNYEIIGCVSMRVRLSDCVCKLSLCLIFGGIAAVSLEKLRDIAG